MNNILGQKIVLNNKDILSLALTHRSASKKNNERLEFLGDSILSYVITNWLYKNYPKLPEGKLSRIRASLVKGDTLTEIAIHYQLGEHLILGIGEIKSGGHKRPSVLADAVEAIFGAVYLDQGNEAAEKFILQVMDKWLKKIDPNISDKDAKTRLQEYLQKNGLQIPNYELLETAGKDHLQTLKMQCNVAELNITQVAINRSRKKAEQHAAQKVLDIIEKKK